MDFLSIQISFILKLKFKMIFQFLLFHEKLAFLCIIVTILHASFVMDLMFSKVMEYAENVRQIINSLEENAFLTQIFVKMAKELGLSNAMMETIK